MIGWLMIAGSVGVTFGYWLGWVHADREHARLIEMLRGRE